jgi:hypothetical protein
MFDRPVEGFCAFDEFCKSIHLEWELKRIAKGLARPCRIGCAQGRASRIGSQCSAAGWDIGARRAMGQNGTGKARNDMTATIDAVRFRSLLPIPCATRARTDARLI